MPTTIIISSNVFHFKLLRGLFSCIISLLTFGASFAQGVVYPKIPKEGKCLNNFLPKGWILLDRATGDLNKDNNTDHAIVIQCADKRNIKIVYGDDTMNSNPRILGILFKDSISDQYNLAIQSNTFIIRHDDSTMMEPYSGISIENGVLKISFHFWYSVGSWYISDYTYKFRYQQNDFKLIGAETSHYDRGTGDSYGCSFNFLIGKYSYSTSTRIDDENYNDKISWRKINDRRLRTFKSFKEPFTWRIDDFDL